MYNLVRRFIEELEAIFFVFIVGVIGDNLVT